MSWPLVSILVTVYNKERTVAYAIRSALEQTYPYTEVIVIDDGSADGSPQICSRFAEKATILSKANGGQVSAANLGFRHAKGDLIILLDADDELVADAVSNIVEIWRPQMSLVFYRLALVDQSGADLGRVTPTQLLPTPEAYARFVERHGYFPGPPQSGYAYARWFLARFMPLDSRRWVGGMDGLFAIAAVFYGEIGLSASVLGQYRLDPESVSHSSNTDINKILGRFLKYPYQYDCFLEDMVKRGKATVNGMVVFPFVRKPDYWMRRIALRKAAPDRYPYVDIWPALVFWSLRSCILAPWIPLRARIGFLVTTLALVMMGRTQVSALFPVLRQSGVEAFLRAWFHRMAVGEQGS